MRFLPILKSLLAIVACLSLSQCRVDFSPKTSEVGMSDAPLEDTPNLETEAAPTEEEDKTNDQEGDFEGENPEDEGKDEDTEEEGTPEEEEAPPQPPPNDPRINYQVKEYTVLDAPGASQAFVPGQTYLSPFTFIPNSHSVVVSETGNMYTLLFYPCDPMTRNFAQGKATFCARMTLNHRTAIGASISLGSHQRDLAYQAPSIYFDGGFIYMTYSNHRYVENRTAINLVRFSPITGVWQRVARYLTAPGQVMGYLGGAYDPIRRQIYVSGAVFAGDRRILRIVRFNNGVGEVSDVFQSNSWQAPLYTHIVVVNGFVRLLTTLSHMIPCPENGVGYTNFKNVVAFAGAFGAIKPIYSNASSDVAADPQYLGSRCKPGLARFPLELHYDSELQTPFAILRSQEANSIAYPLYKNDTIVSDLATAFRGVLDGIIVSLTMKRIKNTYIFVATDRKTIAIASTRDPSFKKFDVWKVPSGYYPKGVYGLKINKDHGNGSKLSPNVHIVFNGDQYIFSSSSVIVNPTNTFLRTYHLKLSIE